jgi:hypothetical protein
MPGFTFRFGIDRTMSDTLDELRLLIRSRHPIITIETDEEQRATARVRQAVEALSMQLFVWNIVEGLRTASATAAMETMPQTQKPLDVLANIISKGWPAVYVLEDLCVHLKDAKLQRMLRSFAQTARERQQTIVLIDPTTNLPEALSRMAVPFELSQPDETEIDQIIRDTFKELSRFSKIRTELTRSQFGHIIRTLRGLTAQEIRMAISRVILDDDCLNADDIGRLLEVKREMVREAGVLEYVDVGIDLDHLGGLDNLKKWLAKRKGVMSLKAKEFGLEPPRGILLLGVQGCGKSAACKSVAASWQLPLLKLDPGQLYDKYVGESERNLRKAIVGCGGVHRRGVIEADVRNAAELAARSQVAHLLRGDGQRHQRPASRAGSQGAVRRGVLRGSAGPRHPREDLCDSPAVAQARSRQVRPGGAGRRG